MGKRDGEALSRRPAVFLDRDGTLNVSVIRDGAPYAPQQVEDFRLYDDVPAACAALAAAGYALVVATNQPDVARGEQLQSVVEAMNRKLQDLVPAIERVEVSYDSGRDGNPTPRRKPAPGMLLDAAAALGLDLARSWMVGDRWRDVDCGHNAGVKTIFIDRGYAERLKTEPHYHVKSFGEAAAIILANGRTAALNSGSPTR